MPSAQTTVYGDTPNAGHFTSGPASLATNLIAHWKIGEIGGIRLDSAGGFNLLPPSLTAVTVTAEAGKFGRAAVFGSAANSYLTLPKPGFIALGNDDWSWAGWVKGADSGGLEPVASMYISSGNKRAWLCGMQWTSGTDKAVFEVLDAPGDYTPTQVTTAGTIVADTWHFLVFQHSGTDDLVGISLDGETLTTAAHSTGVHTDTGGFDLGRIEGTNSNLRMESVSFWYGKTLTQAEIGALYNGGAGNEYVAAR